MSPTIRKNERVLNLLAYLLRSDLVAPFSEICQNVEGYKGAGASLATVRRRFERDKRTLRSLGVKLAYKYDEALDVWGYLIPKQSAYVAGVKPSGEEVDLLTVLANFAAQSEGPLAENLAGACQKLLAQSPVAASRAGLAYKHFVLLPHTAGDTELSGDLQLLGLAIEEARRVTFTYCVDGVDPGEVLLVGPYGLKFSGGFWYMAGECPDANDILVFRLDRIRDAVRFVGDGDGPEYTIPQDFKIEDYVGRGPWEHPAGKPVKVTLELDETAVWLLEEAEAPRLRLKKRRDGTAVTEIVVTNEPGFYKWLVALGVHAKILSPRRMVKGYIAFLERVRAAWRK